MQEIEQVTLVSATGLFEGNETTSAYLRVEGDWVKLRFQIFQEKLPFLYGLIIFNEFLDLRQTRIKEYGFENRRADFLLRANLPCGLIMQM